MQISYRWLQDFIDLPEPPQELEGILTTIGLEVEALARFEQVPSMLAGVVVGKVLTCGPHPNADKLKVTTVDVGAEAPLHIVCGAPNVAAGQYVPVALVGTTLHPQAGEPLTLKKTKIRGEASEGMICAEDELGLGDEHDGILVLQGQPQPGTPIGEVIELYDDWVFTIGITPNRMDALSHYGVARDLAAKLQRPLKRRVVANDKRIGFVEEGALSEPKVKIRVEDAQGAPRFTGLEIRDLEVKESPDWLRRRLEAIGQRPINNVVDATNYVLHEYGQPLHAYDLAHVAEETIVVRKAKKDEPFTTLDGEARKLQPEDVLVANAMTGMCLAGTMGGKDSGVTMATRGIFLEAAKFDMGRVRRTSKHHNINSDSAYRFERGTDPNMCLPALLRAAELIHELAGGTLSRIQDIGQQEWPMAEITLDLNRTQALIGLEIPYEEMLGILERLEYDVERSNAAHIVQLRVPTYRQDVTRPQDVVEDILRIYGYNEVPEAKTIRAQLDYNPKQRPHLLQERLCDELAGMGFTEIWTNSLVDKQLGNEQAVQILNPLSEELAILRQSLLPSLVEVAAYNMNRQAEGLQLFELGKVYHTTDKPQAGMLEGYAEQRRIALAVSGLAAPLGWRKEAQPFDYFHLKGQVERLLQRALPGVKPTVTDAEHPHLAYGLAYSTKQGTLLQLGRIRPELEQRYDAPKAIYAAELDLELLEALRTSQKQHTFEELPQHPAVRRDLSMLVPAGVQWAAIHRVVASANPTLIQSVELFDVFKQKDAERTSYALAVRIQDRNKTLNDKTVDKLMGRIMQLLEQELGVEVRTGS